MQSKRLASVVTVSDSASAGTRQDVSGEVVENLLADAGFSVLQRSIVPDELDQIVDSLRQLSEMPRMTLIVTTGGTGLGPRDVTPEATMAVIERTIPGMAEAMRADGYKKTPFAMTSRQVVGVTGNTLIVNLPGSPKAVSECFSVIQPVLHHVLDLLAGNTEHGQLSKQ